MTIAHSATATRIFKCSAASKIVEFSKDWRVQIVGGRRILGVHVNGEVWGN